MQAERQEEATVTVQGSDDSGTHTGGAGWGWGGGEVNTDQLFSESNSGLQPPPDPQVHLRCWHSGVQETECHTDPGSTLSERADEESVAQRGLFACLRSHSL